MGARFKEYHRWEETHPFSFKKMRYPYFQFFLLTLLGQHNFIADAKKKIDAINHLREKEAKQQYFKNAVGSKMPKFYPDINNKFADLSEYSRLNKLTKKQVESLYHENIISPAKQEADILKQIEIDVSNMTMKEAYDTIEQIRRQRPNISPRPQGPAPLKSQLIKKTSKGTYRVGTRYYKTRPEANRAADRLLAVIDKPVRPGLKKQWEWSDPTHLDFVNSRGQLIRPTGRILAEGKFPKPEPPKIQIIKDGEMPAPDDSFFVPVPKKDKLSFATIFSRGLAVFQIVITGVYIPWLFLGTIPDWIKFAFIAFSFSVIGYRAIQFATHKVLEKVIE